MNRQEIFKRIAAHREKLAKDFGVKSLALFGSVARNEAAAEEGSILSARLKRAWVLWVAPDMDLPEIVNPEARVLIEDKLSPKWKLVSAPFPLDQHEC